MKNNKLLLLSLVVAMAASTMVGCGDKEEKPTVVTSAPQIQVIADAPAITIEGDDAAEPVVEESREGMYRNELNNEWIDESIKNQRPIAAMVDNEKTALPHYGLTKADIVYEITNSTANDGVTRFMVMVKDWGNIEQLGSIRSVRPTNLQLITEWNAVICHDGGPFYIDDYLKKPYVDHFSGTFSRVDNGKAREFTEYILPGDLDKNFNNSGVDREYNEYYPGAHYQFTSESAPVNMDALNGVKSATKITMPYRHNKPWLEYDAESKTYKYFEYGSAHVDAGNGNEQLAFKNLLLQNARYVQFDDHGYMMFHSIDYNRDGWYITDGKAIPITWSKEDELTPTRYYDLDGNEITLNTGKIYVALVPDDIWSDLTIQ